MPRMQSRALFRTLPRMHGGKEDEELLDAMTKVQKAMSVAESGIFKGRSLDWDRGGEVF